MYFKIWHSQEQSASNPVKSSFKLNKETVPATKQLKQLSCKGLSQTIFLDFVGQT